MNNKISSSHLLSSLTVHCSYRLKFFVVKDHLWDGNSLPQLQSSWLRSTTRGSRIVSQARLSLVRVWPARLALEGLSTQRVWHSATRRGDRDWVKCARRSRAIHYKINNDVCGFHPVLYATQLKIVSETCAGVGTEV